MTDNNNILEKLDGLVARFEQVSTLITDPAVIADQKRYVKLTKEYKELDDLMKARKEYIQTLANIDGTCEGIKYKKWNCFTVQFHPEANGGPKDTEFLFDRFLNNVKAAKKEAR